MVIVRYALLELRNRGFVVNHKKVQRSDESPWFTLLVLVVNVSTLHTRRDWEESR